jgi:hypothetical protein
LRAVRDADKRSASEALAYIVRKAHGSIDMNMGAWIEIGVAIRRSGIR